VPKHFRKTLPSIFGENTDKVYSLCKQVCFHCVRKIKECEHSFTYSLVKVREAGRHQSINSFLERKELGSKFNIVATLVSSPDIKFFIDDVGIDFLQKDDILKIVNA